MSNLLVRTEQGSGQQQVDSGQGGGELWMEVLRGVQLSIAGKAKAITHLVWECAAVV